MTQPLSPTAQAVMDAYHAAPIVGVFPQDSDQLGVAAALRALAHQADSAKHWHRDQLLAIAAELEAMP